MATETRQRSAVYSGRKTGSSRKQLASSIGRNRFIPTSELTTPYPADQAHHVPAPVPAHPATGVPAWLSYREAIKRYDLTRSGIDRLRKRGILEVKHIPCHGLRVSVRSIETLFAT